MGSSRYPTRYPPLLMPEYEPLTDLDEADYEPLTDLDEAEYEPLTGLDEANPMGPSLIDLEQIPSRLWEQTLSPLHAQQRYFVAHQVRDKRLREIASQLAFELDMADCDRRNARDEAHHRARRTAAPLPSAHADHPAVRPSVQVNLRLRADDHGRLAQAATSAGMKPTTLARALVLNGVARILADHQRRDTP